MTCPFAEKTECEVKRYFRQNFLRNHQYRAIGGELSGFEHTTICRACENGEWTPEAYTDYLKWRGGL